MVIIDILFAFLIHWAFSELAPNRWFEAKWTAGELLAYASTVALGLLVVWQNKKFQVENEKSQQRMADLAQIGNKISVISKIIEYESTNITNLKIKK